MSIYAYAVPLALGVGALVLYNNTDDNKKKKTGGGSEEGTAFVHETPHNYRNRLNYFPDDLWKPVTGIGTFAYIDDHVIVGMSAPERPGYRQCHPGLTKQNGKLVNNSTMIEMSRLAAKDPQCK